MKYFNKSLIKERCMHSDSLIGQIVMTFMNSLFSIF